MRKSTAASDKTGEINVILVADVDMLHSEFFDLRARRMPEAESALRLDADNVTFVLNLLDVLAGDTRFVEVRKSAAGASPVEHGGGPHPGCPRQGGRGGERIQQSGARRRGQS